MSVRGMTAMGLLAVATLLAAPAAGEIHTRPEDRDSLRLYLEGLAAFGFTGEIVVAEGDSVIAQLASGRAEDGGPMTLNTCLAAGSIAKSVAAAVVVRLAARGTLSIDDALSRHLPGVPDDRAGVTLRQLLSHQSGTAENGDTREHDERDSVVARIFAVPPVASPGERFVYSNAGFELLAAVIEHVTGRSYGDVVRDELLGPAGMHASGTGAGGSGRCESVAAGGNEWRRLSSLGEWRQKWAGSGAGDLVTTAPELMRWGRVLQGAGSLSAAELDTLLAARVPIGRNLAYGFGVYVVPVADGPAMISIGGNVRGYHAAAWIERQAPWRITVVMTNREHFGRGLAVSAIQRSLWGLLDDEPADTPPPTVPWPFAMAAGLAGTWTLRDGSTLELTVEGDGLRAGMSGGGLMDIVHGADSSDVRDALEARARQILVGACREDEADLANALHPVEYELWGRALRVTAQDARARLGPLRDVLVSGTVPLPWLGRGRRTYLRMRFARGELDASLAWFGEGLLDVSFGEGRPHPVLLPVAPLAEGGLGAWSVLDGRVVRLQPYRDRRGTAIVITGDGGRAVARRARR